MNIFKNKNFGIVLILIGAFIPCITYPLLRTTVNGNLAKAYYAERGILYKSELNDLELVIKKGTVASDGVGDRKLIDHKAIPYKFILAGGIVIVFAGITVFIFGTSNNHGNT